jgi:hypothetical protein
MNERIRELAAIARGQAIVGTTVDEEQWKQHEQFVEKFAELIVKECIELTMNEKLRYSSSYNKEADWAKQLMMLHCATSMDNYKILLREHFGVKE